MKKYDNHIHSENSHDGKIPVMEICKHAIKLNFSGITITDHFDCEKYSCPNDYKHILKSVSDIQNAKKAFENKLEIFVGVEIADRIYKEHIGKACTDLNCFDFVLASLHSKSTGIRIRDDFESFHSFEYTTPEEDKAILDLYYKNLCITAENDDYDSLAHCTYPLRYLNSVYKKDVSLKKYEDNFEKIFLTLIRREKSLEINTSGFARNWQTTMPDENLIKMYYSLGGRLITIGSDAHIPEHIGSGFDNTFKMLKDIGFTEYYFYKKRKPVPVSL